MKCEFTSSINLKVNGKDTGHAKDKLSEDFLNAFGVNIQDGVIKTYGDIVSIVDI
ncbi:hypothetical protein [Marispirochaeta aestuarii]|uniref:hypothetical protein n=1 Tax=Marispirochaeta aestuarii TaxID=1963862 RepID=UPI0029C85582|nr:hypothetical protein [Marispirochaeta aestuarii]